MKKIVIVVGVLMLSMAFSTVVLAGDPLLPGDGTQDPDLDDLSNFQEYMNGTDPYNADTDGDGLPDGWEVFNGMDPVTPADAHRNNDYDDDESIYGYGTGENAASGICVQKSIDYWPSDGLTTVWADQQYDNYEEYYRAYSKDEFPGLIFYMHTDINLPDTDGDLMLDPDDQEPLNFKNDGTSAGCCDYEKSNSPVEKVEPYVIDYSGETEKAIEIVKVAEGNLADTGMGVGGILSRFL